MRFRWRKLFARKSFTAVGLAIILVVGAIGMPIFRYGIAGWWQTLFPGQQNNSGISVASVRQDSLGNPMAAIPGGVFTMGDNRSRNPDERPAHRVRIAPFELDTHPVTNDQFDRFVSETGYRTSAERSGQAWVYESKNDQWKKRRGADWQHPGGPETSLSGRGNHPVVQVSWHDAVAYTSWASKRLPSEAEWERAARGGQTDARFPWGEDENRGGRFNANYRQSSETTLAGDDGFTTTSPVETFPPNRFGLHDMAGNVWQWTADWFDEEYYNGRQVDNSNGPSAGKQRVIRGGSWHTPAAGIKVWTRGHLPPDASYQHVGFRCAESHVTTAMREKELR